MNILQDIMTAVKLTGEIRKARKAGANAVQIKAGYAVPLVTFAPAYVNTIEGCQTHKLGRETDQTVMSVFKNLPYETQRQLEYSPKNPGEWVERAKFWQRELKPALPSEMYHTVMVTFIRWYAHCLRMRKGAET